MTGEAPACTTHSSKPWLQHSSVNTWQSTHRVTAWLDSELSHTQMESCASASLLTQTNSQPDERNRKGGSLRRAPSGLPIFLLLWVIQATSDHSNFLTGARIWVWWQALLSVGATSSWVTENWHAFYLFMKFVTVEISLRSCRPVTISFIVLLRHTPRHLPDWILLCFAINP